MALSEKRKGRITGSNVGAILGLSPFRTADDVLRDMVRQWHGAEPEFTGNVATEYGSFHETGAVIDFQIETGIGVLRNEEFFIHTDYDWLGATPDGFTSDGNVIEIKCPYGKRALEDSEQFLSALDQRHYYAQMQIELACTGKEVCYFYQWSSKCSMFEIVRRDSEFIEYAIGELLGFYNKFRKEIENPDHLKPRRAVVESPKAAKFILEYQELSDAIDQANERKKTILEQLVGLVGGVDAEVCGHKLTKVEKEGAISYAQAIKKYAPEADLEPFRGKPSSYWRLT
jgi:putative phage-type endonuclease